LEAILEDGEASGLCDFSVDPESAQPVIHSIWVEPFAPDVGATPEPTLSVCPGDKMWVYVQASGACGETPERVEMHGEYPAGSGEWTTLEMFYVDGETYRHPLTAHEDPGTAFYIYVQDAYGNWVESDTQIFVVDPCVEVLYDFVAMAPQAEWLGIEPYQPYPDDYPNYVITTTHSLDFGGEDTDSLGFVLYRDDYTLEDGSQPEFVLETHPTWVENGGIRGRYDLRHIEVQQGDRFVGRVGFLHGAGAGDVTFELTFTYMGSGSDDVGYVVELGTLPDQYDGQIRDWVIPMPEETIGQQGRFYLVVNAGPTAAQDWAAWVEARLERP
jgi:hypothetical protein